jgi:hypothetical protein
MASLSPVTLLSALYVEGGVTVYKPSGEKYYHVLFRYGPERRQVNRSTGKEDYAEAKVRASEIFAEVISGPKQKAEVSEMHDLLSQGTLAKDLDSRRLRLLCPRIGPIATRSF